MTPSSILIVDDHPMMRIALRTSLEDHPDLQVMAEAGSIAEAREKITGLMPDLVLLDLNLPDGNGLELLTFCRQLIPPVRCLVLTSSDEERDIFQAVQAGTFGYLLKDSSPEQLLLAVRSVLAGENYISARATGILLNQLRQPQAEIDEGVSRLSRREKEILHLMAKGTSSSRIAENLQITESTLRTHFQHILKKLGLQSRSQAVIFAVKNRL